MNTTQIQVGDYADLPPSLDRSPCDHYVSQMAVSKVPVAILLLLLIFPRSVGASNFGSSGSTGSGGTTNGVFLTDGAFWSIAKRQLTSASSTGVSNAAADYMSTSLNPYVTAPSSCSDALHDVCVFDSDYGDNGFKGWNACAGTTTGGHAGMVCSLNWARFNLNYSSDKQALACHELGHGVGLRHTAETSSCMYTPTSSSNRWLSDHEKDNINWWYCNWGPC